MDLSLIDISSVAAKCSIGHAEDGDLRHAGDLLAAVLESDQGCPERNMPHEGLRAVNGVDHPAVAGVGRSHEALLLAEDGVAGPGGGEGPPLLVLLHDWRDFFTVMGGAGAALIGSMFVVVSIATGILTRSRSRGWHAYLTPSRSSEIVQELPIELEPPYGRIKVTIPQGEHGLWLRFRDTPPRTVGTIITGVSLLVALGLIIWTARNKKSSA